MQRRILYINPTADLYGASRSLLRLIESQDSEAYRPIVIVPERGPLIGHLEAIGVAVKVFPHFPVVRRQVVRSWRILPFGALLLPYVVYLWWFLHRHNIDLVHTNSGVIFIPAIAAWLRRTPHVWHVREMFADEFGQAWKLYRSVMLFLSDRIICVSSPIAGQFGERSKVVVIYNGFDLAAFEVDPASVEACREQLGAAPGESQPRRLVGVIGRISPRKGQRVLLHAAEILWQQGYDNLNYIIVGDTFPGNEREEHELRTMAACNLNEKVIFTGFVAEPKPIIAALDILVLPSILPEAFPGTVIEGMALRVPVIATAIGGTIEQIEHEQSGLLIPPGDPEALAIAIRRFLEDADLANAVRCAGRKTVESRFSVEIMQTRIQSLYSKILHRNRRISH